MHLFFLTERQSWLKYISSCILRDSWSQQCLHNIFYGFTSQMRWLLSVTETHTRPRVTQSRFLTHHIYIFTLFLSLTFVLGCLLICIVCETPRRWPSEMRKWRVRLLSSRKMVLSCCNAACSLKKATGFVWICCWLFFQPRKVAQWHVSAVYANQTLVFLKQWDQLWYSRLWVKMSVVWCSPPLFLYLFPHFKPLMWYCSTFISSWF